MKKYYGYRPEDKLDTSNPPQEPVRKKSGFLVITKTGLTGRTYHYEETINGKVVVHTEKGKLLCRPETLKIKGFID